MNYGNLKIMRKFCSFPGLKIPGVWQHGWSPIFYNEIAEMVIASNGLTKKNKNNTYFVAVEHQREALIKEGYSDVHAIGLPIIYLPEYSFKRKTGSL